MNYSIEISKIVEGALKRDNQKVVNYTKLLAEKLEKDGEERLSKRFIKLISQNVDSSLTTMGLNSFQNSIPVDNESRMTLAEIIYPDNNTESVILSAKNEREIQEFILSYQKSDDLYRYGIGLSNTLLLYGPPGCGKTKSAYLIAKELNLPLVIARLDSLISSYLGTTAKNIRTLFDFAQRYPCVLFLDEFDAIAKARDDTNEMGELKRVVNSLLQNVDKMSKDSLLIAATNHERLLDPAVWRRFEYKLEIDYPDEKAIREMISVFSGNRLIMSEKELDNIIPLFKGLSGADIETIIKKATRNSILYSTDLSINNIYNEFFNHKRLIPQDCTDAKRIISIKAKYLRSFNPKVFSLQTIADILGCSKSFVSKMLKEDV